MGPWSWFGLCAGALMVIVGAIVLWFTRSTSDSEEES